MHICEGLPLWLLPGFQCRLGSKLHLSLESKDHKISTGVLLKECLEKAFSDKSVVAGALELQD